MSWEALTWASNDKMKLGSPTARGLLILLANYADEEGKCFPSHEKLQKVTEFSARAVQLNMNKLEEWGLIERKRERNEDGTLGRTRYRLCLEKNPATISANHKHDVPVDENGPPPAPDAGDPPARGAGQDNLHEDNHQSTPVAPRGAVADGTSISGKDDPLYGEFIRYYAPPPTASLVTPLRQWAKLSEVDKRKAITAIPAYRAACAAEKPKPRKMLDPSAYLSRRIFDNFAAPAPRAPEGPAITALRRALDPSFGTSGVLVEYGSPEWQAWSEVAAEAGFPLRAIGYPARPMAGRPNAATGRYLPSQWPPSRDGPDHRQRAAGDR